MDGKQEEVVCSAGQVAVDGVPGEIKILPLGMVHNVRQDFLVDEESCQKIIESFRGRRLDLVIDYEHQTLKDIQAPAAGWIKDIKKGGDSLIAVVEWTLKAQEYLKNKEYRYLSPVVFVRKTDNKAIGLHSAALTNTPAIDGMFAIVNSAGFPAGSIETKKQGGTKMEFLQKIAELLGLPPEATETDVAAAVEALKKGENKQQEQEVVANSTILSMLGLKADAKTDDVTAKIQQIQSGGSDVMTELAVLKQTIAKRDAEHAVGTALKEGKITSAQKEWAEMYAMKDPEGFQSFCSKAAPVVPVGKMDIVDARTDGKTEVDMTVLKNMGLTKEDLDKYASEEGKQDEDRK